jgi:hypothetical protein
LSRKPTIHALVRPEGTRPSAIGCYGTPARFETKNLELCKKANYRKRSCSIQSSVELLWSNTAWPSLRQVAGIAHLVFCSADLELLHRFASEQSHVAKSDKSASGIPAGCGVRGSSFLWGVRRLSTSICKPPSMITQ